MADKFRPYGDLARANPSTMGGLVPTMTLRFVERVEGKKRVRILQQWYSEDVPTYMRSSKMSGEWRDVEVVTDG